MSTTDSLLWIGSRYTIPRFVHEAMERGCCRKVPSRPAWLAEGGRHRVFLAHQDDLSHQHGVIFGYFELAGVDEVISDASFAKRRNRRLGSESDEDGWIETFIDALLDCESEPGLIPHFRTRLETRRICGLRPFESSDRQAHSSRRPAYYLVDQLTREIDRQFCMLIKALVKEVMAEREKLEAGGKRRRMTYEDLEALRREVEERASTRDLFGRAIKNAHRFTPTPPDLPSALAKHTEVRGTLVLFKEPYPVFQRLPNASFRSSVTLDGDELLAEVAEAYQQEASDTLSAWRARQVSLPYIREENGPLTQAALVAELAQTCQVSKALASDFLHNLEHLIADELRRRGLVRLSKIGRFSTGPRQERRGRNPATGESAVIPAGVAIRFRPAAALSRQLAAP